MALNRNCEDTFDFYLKTRSILLYDYEITSITPLLLFENAQELFLRKNHIQNIDGFSVFKKLRELDLQDNQIQDIAAIGDLTTLEKLNVSNNIVRNIYDIIRLKKLNFLSISGNIADLTNTIDVVDELPNLQQLIVSDDSLTKLSRTLSEKAKVFPKANTKCDPNIETKTILNYKRSPLGDFDDEHERIYFPSQDKTGFIGEGNNNRAYLVKSKKTGAILIAKEPKQKLSPIRLQEDLLLVKLWHKAANNPLESYLHQGILFNSYISGETLATYIKKKL